MGIALHYDFLTTPSLTGHDTAGLASTTPDLSITRATKATVVKSDGLIHEVSAGVARFTGATYSGDTASGTSTKGLLVEEARTNICLYSEDYTRLNWSKGNASISANAAVAPDGATTMDRFSDDSGTGTGSVSLAQTVTVATTTTYTYSVFAKADQLGYIALSTILFTTPANAWSYFNLSTGAVISTAAAHDSAGIEDYGNGIYRCWITFTTDAVDTSGLVGQYLSQDGTTTTVDRDGTSSIYVWGSQFEAGAFPTSYIPTTTTSVTRNADDVSSSDVSWFNSDGTGSWYVSGKMSNEAGTGGSNDPAIVEISASSAYFIAHRLFNTSTAPRLWSSGETNNIFDGSTTTFAAGDDIKWASGWAENDVAGYMNGSAEQSASSWDLRAAPMTAFLVGKNTVSHYWNGHIAEIAYIDVREPDSLLSDLSDGTVTLAEQYGSDTIIERRRRAHYKRQKLRAQGVRARETWAGSYRGRRIR